MNTIKQHFKKIANESFQFLVKALLAILIFGSISAILLPIVTLFIRVLVIEFDYFYNLIQ